MRARFYYDIGSPYAYLAAERVDRKMSCDVEWRPVLLGALFKATGRSSWALSEGRRVGMAEVERRAAARGVTPLQWPDPWPNDGLRAMRVAVYADTQGRGREFALEAFRVQFRDGQAMSRAGAIASAARRAGLDPDEALDATDDPDIKQQLRDRTEEALRVGVFGVPSIVTNNEVFWGDDRLEKAALAAPVGRDR